MNQVIALNIVDLALAAVMVLLLALLSEYLRLGIARSLIISACRTVVQLSLLGLVLKVLFAQQEPVWIILIMLVMLLAAGYEVMARQQRKFKGQWGYMMGTMSMFVSSFGVTVFAVLILINVDPWYHPQYLIPLLGMLLGNTMTGIALALNGLTQSAWQQRGIIEAKLLLGYPWYIAIEDIRRDNLRQALIPIINSMSAAGLVSLPGMMTGQILSGTAPMEAAKYQILIMFLIAVGTGLGAILALWAGSRHLFDERQRLRLDRLTLPSTR